MKKLIFQYYIGDTIPRSVQISIKRFKQYADLHEADYHFSNQSKFAGGNGFYEVLRTIYDTEFDEYDKILYVDTDVDPERMDENIFDVEIKDVGMWPELPRKGMRRLPAHASDQRLQHDFKDCCNHFNLQTIVTEDNERYNNIHIVFNSGVILWNRSGIEKARKTFMDWKEWSNYAKKYSTWYMNGDQPYLTSQVVNHLDFTFLDGKWNTFARKVWNEDIVPNDTNFIHYTGRAKLKLEERYRQK